MRERPAHTSIFGSDARRRIMDNDLSEAGGFFGIGCNPAVHVLITAAEKIGDLSDLVRNGVSRVFGTHP